MAAVVSSTIGTLAAQGEAPAPDSGSGRSITRTSRQVWPSAAATASAISGTGRHSASAALRTRSPGVAAARRTSSATSSTSVWWKRLEVVTIRSRPSRIRFTTHHSREAVSPAPKTAEGRRMVTGADADSRSTASTAALQAAYPSSPGAAVGCVSAIGIGSAGAGSSGPARIARPRASV